LSDFVKSIEIEYTFKIVFSKNDLGEGIGANTNYALGIATGELVHILHQDDYLVDDHLYADIALFFQNQSIRWALVGNNTHSLEQRIRINSDTFLGFNDLGGPSIAFMRRSAYLPFDNRFSLFADLEFFEKMRRKWGEPLFFGGYKVHLRTGNHQHQHTFDATATAEEIKLAIETFDLPEDLLENLKTRFQLRLLSELVVDELLAAHHITKATWRNTRREVVTLARLHGFYSWLPRWARHSISSLLKFIRR
jgi:hypothetical protein